MHGELLASYVFDQDLPELERCFERRRAGVVEQFEFRLRRRDGQELWALVSTNPLLTNGVYCGAMAVLSDITALKLAETELAARALRDPLTGLPNRDMLVDRLELALARRQRHGGEVAVLFCDLDGFKTVNDTLGHAAGDALLRDAGARLRDAVRSEDTVARYGGDEFVVLCEGLADERQALAIAEQVLLTLQSQSEQQPAVPISIGVAVTSGTQENVGTLLRRADDAMYGAKRRGGRRAQLFNSPALDEAGASAHADPVTGSHQERLEA